MFQWVLQQLSPPFIQNHFRQLLGNTNHWQTGPGPRGGWAWWWSSPWSLCQGFSPERWQTRGNIIHDKPMSSVMQWMLLNNKINNRIVETLRYPAHFIFLQSIFSLGQLIFVVASVTDVSMVLSAIWLPGLGSENPGLWAPAPGLSVPQQTRDNKNMANTEQSKSRGNILVGTLIWARAFQGNCKL